MSKVICDVCGTTYPETASQCPICGAAKTNTTQTAAGESVQPDVGSESGYTPVKGGRFSKSNVRKRNSSAGKAAASSERHSSSRERQSQNSSSNKGLVIVVVILLLAIIAVVGYIAVKFFDIGGTSGGKETNNTNPGTSQSTEPSESEGSTGSNEQEIPCTHIQLSNVVIELDEVDASWLLTVETDPLDTTDEITFESSDETVATVNDEGVVTARGSGQAVITVTCGEATAECRVVCSFGEETEPSDEPTETTPPTEAETELKLNSAYQSTITGKYDVTLTKPGQVWKAYVGTIPVTEITWSVDDPAVATIDENGKVTAVAPGKTEIHAQYMGQTVTAIVRCNWSTETTPPETEATQPAPTQPVETQPAETQPASGYYMIVKVGSWSSRVENGGEFTISQGESVTLELHAADGTLMTVSWSPLDPAVCSASGNTITGVAKGATEVACKAPDGSVLSCIVRVKAA